jgi:hypothetical protein
METKRRRLLAVALRDTCIDAVAPTTCGAISRLVRRIWTPPIVLMKCNGSLGGSRLPTLFQRHVDWTTEK